jgi:hypothetical protein
MRVAKLAEEVRADLTTGVMSVCIGVHFSFPFTNSYTDLRICIFGS